MSIDITGRHQEVRRLRRPRRRHRLHPHRPAHRAARARPAAASPRCCGSSPASTRPTPGTISIEGTDATKLPPQKRNVGFVFQHYAVFKHMTVAKNVAFGLEIRKRPKAEVEQPGRRAAQAGAPLAVLPPAALAALRRPAPADGAGPGARGGADGAAARRAVRRARRQGPQGAARLAAPAARRGARDHRLRDPRPGGGPRGRRRDRGHQRGPGRADRHARRSSTTSRPTTS